MELFTLPPVLAVALTTLVGAGLGLVVGCPGPEGVGGVEVHGVGLLPGRRLQRHRRLVRREDGLGEGEAPVDAQPGEMERMAISKSTGRGDTSLGPSSAGDAPLFKESYDVVNDIINMHNWVRQVAEWAGSVSPSVGFKVWAAANDDARADLVRYLDATTQESPKIRVGCEHTGCHNAVLYKVR